jgi:hypothetical protein
MEDYIYIIALIAWVLFAFYRNSRKKAQAAGQMKPHADTRTEPMPLPTLEEILLGREPEPAPEPLPAPAAEWTEGTSPVFKETAFEKEYNRMGISSVEELDKPMTMAYTEISEIQKHEIGSAEEVEENQGMQIDLRRAVIYAEILNRPYV